MYFKFAVCNKILNPNPKSFIKLLILNTFKSFASILKYQIKLEPLELLMVY